MSREPEYEQHLADWLADGPVDAPEGAIQAAVAFARSHPRRLGRFAALWRASMDGHRRVWVGVPAPRSMLTRFAGLGVVVVIGLVAVGAGSVLLNQGSQPSPAIPGASASPSPASSESPSPAPSGAAGLVHVTGTVTFQGLDCSASWCDYIGLIDSSDATELVGHLSLQTWDSTSSGTWGVAKVCEGSDCPWGWPYDTYWQGKPAWQGDWFTTGPRPSKIGEYSDPLPPYSLVLPVDTIWLRGGGSKAGHTALLRIDPTGRLDGWIFPSALQP